MIHEMPDDLYAKQVAEREKIRSRWSGNAPLSKFPTEKASIEQKLAGYGYSLVVWFNYWNYDSIRVSYAVTKSGLNYCGDHVGNWHAYGFAPWETDFAMMLKLRFGGM